MSENLVRQVRERADPILSICIPTYNFGNFIEETINSISSQLGAGVEIVVVDGASTDNTPEIMARLMRECEALHYHRLPAKGGIDRDMATSIDFARGRYCWLFSADDIMLPGALQKAKEAIRSEDDVYLCTHSGSTIDLEPVYDRWPVLRFDEQTTFDLGDPNCRTRYFAAAETTEAFFSFMGGLIVRRQTWNSVPLNESFVNTCWAHAARLLALASNGLKVTYLPTPLLIRRGDNDSFAQAGFVKRLAIAIDGYHRIADELFGAASLEAANIKRVLRNELKIISFLNAKVLCNKNPVRENIIELDRLAIKHFLNEPLFGYPKYMLFKFAPPRVYETALGIYRAAKRMRPSRTRAAAR